MRKLTYILILCLVALVGQGCKKEETANNSNNNTAVAPYATMEQDIFTLINQHRTSISLPALTANVDIANVSRQHSVNMVNQTVAFGHDGFNDRVNTLSGKMTVTAAAENVAMGYPTASEAVIGWLNSTGHRANIEGNYTHTGIGIGKTTGGTYYYTQIFIKQ